MKSTDEFILDPTAKPGVGLRIPPTKELWGVRYFHGNMQYVCSNPDVKRPNFLVKLLIKYLMFGEYYEIEKHNTYVRNTE